MATFLYEFQEQPPIVDEATKSMLEDSMFQLEVSETRGFWCVGRLDLINQYFSCSKIGSFRVIE